MMKMNNREEIYSYLKQYDREYSLAKNSEERDRIENNVRNFAEGRGGNLNCVKACS